LKRKDRKAKNVVFALLRRLKAARRACPPGGWYTVACIFLSGTTYWFITAANNAENIFHRACLPFLYNAIDTKNSRIYNHGVIVKSFAAGALFWSVPGEPY
jgi:hypothetical protein